MSSPVQDKDFQTDWAFYDDFTTHIHISEAKSGLNGYYCLGCKKQMQAVKGPIRTHYFRHHAKDVDRNNDECVIANRTYRERIAKDVLHRLKELKVPAVYKYPPKNSDGLPNKLVDPTIIKAHKVKSELTFYEDDNCNIQFGQNPTIDERYLLIRPDITFFNNKNEPILLVEFVITHKINNDKRIKLKRLGLNTVQIIVPKKSEQDIEKALKSRTKVKWIYNEIEASTNYVFIPQSNNSGIRALDDDQQRIFEESYKCRASQIKYLIRAVKRALESQSYKRAEQYLDQEISRVEEATKRAKEELRELEEQYSQEVFSEFAGEYEAIETETKGFQIYVEDLEDRYKSADKQYRKEERRVESNIQEQYSLGNTEGAIRERFEQKESDLQQEFDSKREQLKGDIEVYRRNLKKLKTEEDQLSRKFGEIERIQRKYFERVNKEIEGKRTTTEEKIDNFRDTTAESRGTVEARYKIIGERSIEKINQRNSKGDSELSRRIKEILSIRGISSSYNDRLETYERYKSYLELARSRAWEKQ